MAERKTGSNSGSWRDLQALETTSGLILYLRQGIAEKQISQLVDFASNDPEIILRTSDPKRFANRGAYENWKKKGRVVYTLTDQEDPEGNLLGIIWFGEEKLPEKEFISEIKASDYGVTFAIRVYDKARGKKIAKVFMSRALEEFLKSERYKEIDANGIWLETSIENEAATSLYKKNGWFQISNPDENNRILMIFSRN